MRSEAPGAWRRPTRDTMPLAGHESRVARRDARPWQLHGRGFARAARRRRIPHQRFFCAHPFCAELLALTLRRREMRVHI